MKISYKYWFFLSLLVPICYVVILGSFLVTMYTLYPNFGAVVISLNGSDTIVGLICSVLMFSVVGGWAGYCFSQWQLSKKKNIVDNGTHRFGGATSFYDSGLPAVKGQVFEEDFK